MDIDGDNDQDVIVTATIGDSIVWYENNALIWTKRVIDPAIIAPRGAVFIDIDGDEVNDLVVATYNDVVWYKNPFTSVANVDSLDIQPRFVNISNDSILLTASVINPGQHNVQVKALILGSNSSYRDSLQLYDDGTHGDDESQDDIHNTYLVTDALP